MEMVRVSLPDMAGEARLDQMPMDRAATSAVEAKAFFRREVNFRRCPFSLQFKTLTPHTIG